MSFFTERYARERLQSQRFTYVFALLIALTPLGMDAYLPAVEQFAASLNVSAQSASWTLSNFLIGLGVGQLLGGVVSDQLGRRGVTLWGLVLYIVSCVVVLFLQRLDVALVCRFIQGMGGGFITVCAMAMIKDTTPVDKLASRIALAIFVILLMPLVAPMLGAAILVVAPWPAVFLACAGLALAAGFYFWLKIPETHTSKSGQLSLGDGLNRYAYVLGHRVAGRPVLILQALANASGSGANLIFVTSAPALLMGSYQLSSSQFPMAFAVVIVGMLAGNRLGPLLLRHVAASRLYGLGMKLLLTLALLMAALCFTIQLPLWLLLLMVCACVFVVAMIAPAGQAMYLGLVDKNTGTAAAFEQFSRFASGGLLGGLSVSLPLPSVQAFAVAIMVSAVLGNIAYGFCASYWRTQTH